MHDRTATMNSLAIAPAPPVEKLEPRESSRAFLVVIPILVAAALVTPMISAKAQGAIERGAFVAAIGTDTIVVERFTRTPDTLRGSISTKGQPRVEYVAALAPGSVVRSELVTIVNVGAAPGAAPLAQFLTTIDGDTAIVSVGGKTTRVATQPGAVPSMNNSYAVMELFISRAQATGRSGDYAYLALPSGTTYPLTVRPVGEDSMVIGVAGQQHRYKVDAAGRILGGSIIGQPVQITRADSAAAATITFGMIGAQPAPKPDYSAPPGAPYLAEDVSFNGPGGITLGGTLTRPANARGRLPAAITITGTGQQDRDEYIPVAGGVRLLRQVADTLSRVGIAVLRLDDRGLGASGGNFATSTTADFADDIRAALVYLRSRPDIDPDRIALVGHSEGGIIAPMVAATDAKLRAIVTFGGPGEKMIEISMAQNRWLLEQAPQLSPAQRDSLLTVARAALAPERQTVPENRFLMSYDPAPAAAQVKAATLILQGATDRQVPQENAEMLAALIRSGGNKDVTVRIFPATDHLFLADSTGDFRDQYSHVKSNQVSPVILGTMADWLVRELGAGRKR